MAPYIPMPPGHRQQELFEGPKPPPADPEEIVLDEVARSK
jgi:hypothetical protein